MNYIRHLNGFHLKSNSDRRLSAHHISLYMAIFQLWNAAHFEDFFMVNRQELMQMARIGSLNTYHRCLKELQEWDYIEYIPSRNICVGSRIRCIPFENATYASSHTKPVSSSKTKVQTATYTSPDPISETTSDTSGSAISETTSDTTGRITSDTTSDTTAVPPVSRSIKHNKTFINVINNSLSQNHIKKFFESKNFDSREAIRFFYHYQANGWMMGTRPIVDWQAAALKWMTGVENFSKPRHSRRKLSLQKEKTFGSNLCNNLNKRYDEAL